MQLLNDNLFTYETYLSAFTTRYGTTDMRRIWSEINRRSLWRRIWVSIAKEQYKIGLVSKDEIDDIIKHQNTLDIKRAKEIEHEVYHELMAELKTFEEQCTIGGGKLHLGATSTDILDNTTILQIKQSLNLIKKSLIELLSQFGRKIKENKNLICMGYTHLQPAEPITLGYRLSFYAQELLIDLKNLNNIEKLIKGKGIKGAVGTSASYTQLLRNLNINAFEFEKKVMDNLKIKPMLITSQTYSRKIDFMVTTALSNIASTLHKFAFDFRLMVTPQIGEWEETRDSKRIGSSAMPFKKNPDKAEKICSLCRYVSSLINVSWGNPANSLLERTLDDSASQRIFLPESFLAIDECLSATKNLLKNLNFNLNAISQNLEKYGIFSSIEPLMMELVKKGANRQEVHEILKQHSMTSWELINHGKKNPLIKLITNDKKLTKYMPSKEIASYFNLKNYIGNSVERTELFLNQLKSII